MNRYKRINQLFRVVQFTYLASIASFINYLVLYLNHIGFSEIYIGIIHAAGAAAMLIIQPVLGRILDRTQNFRKVLLAVMCFCISAIALMPLMKSLLWLELVMIIVLYALIKQFSNVIDVWTYQLRSQHPEIAYGSTRGIGSIGEGLSAFVMGYLIAWFGFSAMFVVTIGLLAVTLIAGLGIPNPETLSAAARETVKQKAVINRPLVFYIISYLLLRISATLISTFSSLMLQRLGFGSEWYGFSILLCGIAELPIFIWVGRWCQGESVKRWYRICLLLCITGSLLTSLAPNLPIFMTGRILLTITYAIYTITTLEYVKTYVAPGSQAQVMLLIGAFSGSVSYMASSLLGGYLMELGSQAIMALVVSGLLIVSWILHGFAFSRKEKVSC